MKLRAILQSRFTDVRGAIRTIPTAKTWLHCLFVYAVFAALAITIGFSSGLLRLHLAELSPATCALLAITTFVSPALLEELFFRVLPLPRNASKVTKSRLVLISILSLFVFVAAHPVTAWLFRPTAWVLFTSPVFLAMATLLGLACTVVYLISKSLWPPVLLHWVAVLTWITVLGGQALLSP